MDADIGTVADGRRRSATMNMELMFPDDAREARARGRIGT